MKAKRTITKRIVSLIAVLAMLVGTTLTAAAEEGMTVYWKADGTYTFVNDSQVPAVGANGLPVYHKEYSKAALEASAVTPGGILVYGNWNRLYTPEQMALLYSIIDSAGITNEMSKYDKAVALNNAECAVLYYKDGALTLYNDGLYAVQMGGATMCYGYADLYQTLCQAVGIDCQIAGGEGHAWNILSIDGKEYYNDPTWNDQSGCNAYLMMETPHLTEKCRSTTPEGAAEIYFPEEFRAVRNVGPDDYIKPAGM